MGDLARPTNGDTHGDTFTAQPQDSNPKRRRRKTKAPASISGVEHRWSPERGWRFRARMKVCGQIVTGEWASREEAIEDADRMRARRELLAGGVQIITLEEGCQAVLDTVKHNDGTWRSYHEHFLTICEHFDPDTPLHEITPEEIRGFLTARRASRWRGKPPSEARLRKHVVALGRVFNLAIQNERFAAANPTQRVAKPKPAPRRESDYFTADELGEVLEQLEGWDRAVAAALALSGLRRSELCRVQKKQIDQKGGFIRRVAGKTGERDVPITRPLELLLPELIAGADSDGFLIPKGVCRGPRTPGARRRTDEERRVGQLNRAFARAKKRCRAHLAARLHPHAMRHTLRTILADAGVPEHVKDTFTGHSTAKVAGRYEHASATAVRMWATKVLDPLLWLVDPNATKPGGDGQAETVAE